MGSEVRLGQSLGVTASGRIFGLGVRPPQGVWCWKRCEALLGGLSSGLEGGRGQVAAKERVAIGARQSCS